MSLNETLQLRGTLEGHSGWVTALATNTEMPDLLVSASRDKTLIVWQLTPNGENYAVAKKALKGHSHIVQDVAVSQDGLFVLSASWDKTLRLWSLQDGTSTRFVGHSGDVLSCAFSPDNQLVVSSSRDKTIKLWNVIGEEVFTIEGSQAHSDWVSTVRMVLNDQTTRILSAGWDKLVKTGRINADFVGHTGYVNTLVPSPDGSICASGGKDGQVLMWDVTLSKFLYSLPGGDEVHALAFSPSRYWLAAATSSGIKIYNLKERKVLEELKSDVDSGKEPIPLSLSWSGDGQILFSGYSDNKIRVWQVMQTISN